MNRKPRGQDRRQFDEVTDWPLLLADGQVLAADRRRNSSRRRNDFISCQSLFRDIPYSELEPLIELCDEIILQKDEILLELDKDNHHLYLLIEGQLKVVVDPHDRDSGIQVDPGNVVGEISIIDGQLTTAYVIAAIDCRLLAIPQKVLWENFFKIPDVARNFMHMSAGRFRELNVSFQRALEKQLRLEHLQKELAIAHDIQSSMLPGGDMLCDQFRNVDIAAIMEPANNVAGDFYDAFPLKDGRICVAIGDVSGKGVPASLFMVKTMTLLREVVMHHHNLVKAVRKLNNKLCRDNDRCMFATLVVVIIDPQNGTLSCVNAGHNWPMLGTTNGEFSFLESRGGILVGIKENIEYRQFDFRMKPNDLFLLYTDGVTEAMNNNHEQYSDTRLQALLSTTAIRSAGESLKIIRDSVKQFTNGAAQSDDITMLAVRYIDYPADDTSFMEID